METKSFEIYTDGSCIGNPGPGGWGVLILDSQTEKTLAELSGSEKATTNNRMEMTAMIEALKWLHTKSGLSTEELHKSRINLYSDSNLLIQTLTQGWKRKANTDLWAKIDQLSAWLPIKWTWVKAHANNHLNNHVDELAQKAARKRS